MVSPTLQLPPIQKVFGSGRLWRSKHLGRKYLVQGRWLKRSQQTEDTKRSGAFTGNEIGC